MSSSQSCNETVSGGVLFGLIWSSFFAPKRTHINVCCLDMQKEICPEDGGRKLCRGRAEHRAGRWWVRRWRSGNKIGHTDILPYKYDVDFDSVCSGPILYLIYLMLDVYNFPIFFLNSPSVMVPSKWGLVMDRLMVLFRKFFDILTHIQAFLWRVLELHILKIVALFVIWVALSEVSE